MVDAERVLARLARLEHLLERLEAVRARGRDAYLEVSDAAAFDSLDHLEDLRRFAAVVVAA